MTNPYKKGDFRRTLTVLAAIDAIPGATIPKLEERTGLEKKSITYQIEHAIYQLGIQIKVSPSPEGATYAIEDWGPVLKKKGAMMALGLTLGDQKVSCAMDVVEREFPGLPATQARSLSTRVWQGWRIIGANRAGEISIERPGDEHPEKATVLPDGTIRSADPQEAA